MKALLSILTVLITFSLSAQDSTEVKAETPKIVSKLKLGGSFSADDYTFTFVEVESDSRCPKNVNCVWAGEAVVLVDVYKNDEFIEQKRLKLGASTAKGLALLYVSNDLNIRMFNLLPYPVAGKRGDPEPEKAPYELQFLFEESAKTED